MGLPIFHSPDIGSDDEDGTSGPENIATAMRLLLWAQPGAGDKVLDVGCGSGDVTAIFASRVKHTVAVDVCREQIMRCRQRYPTIDSFVLDCQDLHNTPSICPGTFDKVYSIDALHWILRDATKRASVMKGLFDALKPGGLLICELPNHGSEAEVHSALLAALRRRSLRATTALRCWFPGLSDIKNLVQAQGFEWLRDEAETRVLEVGERDLRWDYDPRVGATGLASGGYPGLAAMRNYVIRSGKGILDLIPSPERRLEVIEAVVQDLEAARLIQCNRNCSFKDKVIRIRFMARKPLA